MVVVGFVAMDNLRDGTVNPVDSGSAPAQPLQGVVGTPGEVTYAENSYEIAIQSATAQPS